LLALTRTLLTPVFIALAVAAVVAFVVVVLVRGDDPAPPPATLGRPSDSAHPSSSAERPSLSTVTPTINWSNVIPTLSCDGVGIVVDARAVSDLNGDGRPDAVISAHCDAGAGSPPSVVEAFLDSAGHPRLLGDLVSEKDDLLVQRLGVRRGLVTVRAQGYSPGTPRCCPDRMIDRTWQVHLARGAARFVRTH
jgi:hypothetical protein